MAKYKGGYRAGVSKPRPKQVWIDPTTGQPCGKDHVVGAIPTKV